MSALTPVLLLLPLAASPASPATCEGLAKLALPATTITSALSVAAGPLTLPQGPPADVPAFCRVIGLDQALRRLRHPVRGLAAGVRMERQVQGAGNGGFAGAMNLRIMARAVAKGYATAATDTGHRADGTDASWALGSPREGRRLRVPGHPRDDGRRQGDRGRVLRPAGAARVFPRLLERRSAGPDGSAALPGRLRRHHRGRARQRLHASPRPGRLEPAGHGSRSRRLHPGLQGAGHRGGHARAMRRQGRSRRRRGRRPVGMPIQPSPSPL